MTNAKTFYVAHGETEKNIGNCKVSRIFKTLEEAQAYKERVNAYHDSENITMRDTTINDITRHSFKTYSEKYREFEEEYLKQHGELPY